MTDTLETENLFYRYDTAAAVLIDEIQADLTHAQKKEAECWKRHDPDGAGLWEIKITKLEKELRAAKGDTP